MKTFHEVIGLCLELQVGFELRCFMVSQCQSNLNGKTRERDNEELYLKVLS